MVKKGQIVLGIILILISISILNYVTIPAIASGGDTIIDILWKYVIGWVGTILLGFLATTGLIAIVKSKED
jgi:hypothetical protein